MDEKLVTSRRQALGLASLAVAGVAVGAPAVATAATTAVTGADPRRPTDAELARVTRLYAGELGGGRGAR